jgi:hypothetical protein
MATRPPSVPSAPDAEPYGQPGTVSASTEGRFPFRTEDPETADAELTEEQEKQMDPLLKSAKIDCTVGMIARIVREHRESRIL